jgi:DNA polymerase-1
MSSLVKQHFTSRYPEGVLLNGDLSAIEMACFAQLTRDYNLIKLINTGVDLHEYVYEMVYGKTIEEVSGGDKDKFRQIRTAVKAVNFGLIYGNGAKTASERTGLTEDECRQIIDTFYQAFPNTKQWQQYNLKVVERQGYLKLLTGSRFDFKKYPAKYDWQKEKGIIESYNPPDIKNYPVQHFAFLIMALILGRFFRTKAIYKRHKYLLINTVHDSIMADCRTNEAADEAQKDIEDIICNIPRYMLNLWNIKMLVPVKMEFGRAKSWHDIK